LRFIALLEQSTLLPTVWPSAVGFILGG